MDYNNLKCPICNTPLEDDDDIVVCPECGAPHHRECYEELGHCYFDKKHSENFDYNEYIKEKQAENGTQTDNNVNSAENGADTYVNCPRCGAVNPKSSFYCSKCGAPINTGFQNQGGGQPNVPPFGAVMFDPMAGMNPDEEIDDGVTAGETAKYVQRNTPYFLRVFANIRDNNRSKFNFAAFLFSGGYMLYRKMYKIGVIFTCIVGALIAGSILVQTLPVFGWMDIYKAAVANIGDVGMVEFYSQLSVEISKLPFIQQFIFFLPSVLSLLKWVFMFIAGNIANRAYFKDTIQKIKKIKEDTKDNQQQKNQLLQTKGGVNTVVAIVLFVCLIIINYVPYFFI